VRGPAHVRRLTHLMMLFVAIAFAALLVCFLVSGGYIMHRLFGGKYDGLNLLLVLIIVEEGFGAVGMPLNCGLLAIKRTAVGFQSQIISAVVAVVIGLPLTYLMGPLGTAFSLCVSKGLSTVFAWVRFDAATEWSAIDPASSQSLVERLRRWFRRALYPDVHRGSLTSSPTAAQSRHQNQVLDGVCSPE
jgi:hypothetical protein